MSTEIHFADLGLAQPLLQALTDAGYTVPTPIQAQKKESRKKGSHLDIMVFTAPL